jgi:hypothetical protein
VNFEISFAAGSQWLHTLGLPIHTQDIDLTLLNTRHNRYLALTDGTLSAWQNLTLRLDTTEVRGHLFQAKVRLTWPKLVSSSKTDNASCITFPLTQIGNTTYRKLTLQNPSSKVVVIQLALDSAYLQGSRLMDNLPERLVFSSVYDLFNDALTNSHNSLSNLHSALNNSDCMVLNDKISIKLGRT